MNIRTISLTAKILALSLTSNAWAQTSEQTHQPAVTYADPVADILERRCVTCHRPGAIGPFPLTSYNYARKWSKMIKEVISTGRMPPWHADGRYGHFSNDRRLTEREYNALIHWIDHGTPRGKSRSTPRPKPRTPGWQIGRPDVIFSMPETAQIPAASVMPYQYYVTQTNFATDRWVQAVEAKPGNPSVVHHILVYIREPGLTVEERRVLGLGTGLLEGYAPGNPPLILEPGVAIKIPARSTLLWQLHYTPTGKPETDRSQLGIKFASAPPKYAHKTGHALNRSFVIPARAGNHRVQSQFVFPADAWLTSLTPHMHLRGKSFAYEARYPNGRREVLLSVPRYDFNWQTSYHLAQAKPMPKGTRILCTATFDNSAQNPYNPNPNAAIGWGDQTWDEMMIGWFTFVWETANQP